MAYGILPPAILAFFTSVRRRRLSRDERRFAICGRSPREHHDRQDHGSRGTGRSRGPPRRPGIADGGEDGHAGSLASQAIRVVASPAALFPIARLVLLPLGPDKDDYLRPGRIFGKMTFDNYSFVLGETPFLDWIVSTLVVPLGTTVIGVPSAATTGCAVSRTRFPGHRKFMWVLLVTQMFPVAVPMVPMYGILPELQLVDSYLGPVLAT
uniref:hypothetical protein n=1 Tax=Streptomyces sp. TG1A-60 TaxID=3129111 RepID=UPI00403FE160